MKKIYGIDLGGTTIKFGLFTERGELIDEFSIVTNTSENGKNILYDISKAIKDNMRKNSLTNDQICGMGIGVPGPVNNEGIVLKCVNLGWDIINVKKILEELTGIITCVGNDANVAALGEVWQGSGKGYKNAVMVTLGTGVGGGILVNGKIIHGTNGAGGEIGHIHINDQEDEKCGCGKKGCLEQYASATGIVRSANKLLIKDLRPSELKGESKLSAKTIFEAATHKDVIAMDLVNGLGSHLGKALANMSCIIDPEIFIIGGGVSDAGDILINTIKDNYKEFAFHASKHTPICIASLGNKAGIYGSADLVLTSD